MKDNKLSASRTESGRLFQSFGAAQINARSPSVTFVNWVGGLRINRSFELRKLWECALVFHVYKSWIQLSLSVRIGCMNNFRMVLNYKV